MNVPNTKEYELLLRVFKLIAGSHFNDHKMISTYCNKIDFDRNLGDDIANYMQSRDPEYYHKERKEKAEDLCPNCGHPSWCGYGFNSDGTAYFYCTRYECQYSENYKPKD
jgi:hypothetical protein